MAKLYQVTIPIAGHACIDIEADNEKQAIERAIEEVELRHIESWEAIERFNQGNICYCPSPWEAEATTEDEDDSEPQP